MQKLVSTNEAASILGLSVQGVHYRIKTNKLDSIKKNGKTYVYVEDTTNTNDTPIKKEKTQHKDVEYVIQLKDEQISLLKKSIKWMRNQHKSEIKRLERHQNKTLEVFKSEVSLLQKAYNEMQNLYKSALPKPSDKQKVDKMSLVDFFILMKKHKKTNFEIKNLILERIKIGDKRFTFDPNTKEIIIYKDSFLDLL